MAAPGPGKSSSSDSLGSSDEDLSGATIDEAIEKAEAGSQVAGAHTTSGQAASAQSRAEEIREVHGLTEGKVYGNPGEPATPPEPGPSPTESGSGGAQNIIGARISDRVAAGEPVPDGPPFDTDSGNTHDSSDTGS
jgi:hypothetical protein